MFNSTIFFIKNRYRILISLALPTVGCSFSIRYEYFLDKLGSRLTKFWKVLGDEWEVEFLKIRKLSPINQRKRQITF